MISCNVRLRKEDAISEVEHPQKLRHSHIIRVAGTYVIGKKFAILLYPAADWNLNEFLDHKEWPTGKEILRTLACLASAVAFLHANAIKHMDIKPHNILIRQLSVPSYSPFDPSSRSYNVYLAGFGIAKSYASAANAETDSLTACTRMYVAPEVVEQERRGLSADIFSLGCVFAEILSYVAGPIQTMRYTGFNVRRLSEISGFSYQANLEMVKSLFRGASFIPVFRDYHIASDVSDTGEFVLRILSPHPELRPSGEETRKKMRQNHYTSYVQCRCDQNWPPFETKVENFLITRWLKGKPRGDDVIFVDCRRHSKHRTALKVEDSSEDEDVEGGCKL